MRCRRVLYGDPAPEDHFDTIMSSLYVQVLRPLCWTGLLDEVGEDRISAADRVFAKTPLWREPLRLTTDSEVRSAVRH